MRAILLLTSLFAAPAAAQVIVNAPNVPAVNETRPFSTGLGRYQQWYNTNNFNAISEPMRFQQIELLAGTNNSGSPQPLSITCEVRMGHGKFSGVFGTFDNNWGSPPVTVVPLGTRTITNGPAGSVCLTLPFTELFTWDQFRPILVEIRVTGNNQGSQPFQFNFAGTSTAVGRTSRVYAGANPGAATGAVSQGVGLITRLSARPGVMLDFGAGCPGEGNNIPQNSIDQIAWPGILWTHTLTAAASQRTAFWVIGDTRTAPFPIDLTTLFGLPASGCMLLTNPVNAIPVVTVGGGAGGGLATLPIQLPATSGYIGASLYTQWVVFDPLAQNSTLAVSPGIWTIVAPLGG